MHSESAPPTHKLFSLELVMEKNKAAEMHRLNAAALFRRTEAALATLRECY